MDDLDRRLDALVATVEQARGLPMSASCVLNRVELLAVLDDVRVLVARALSEAVAVEQTREVVLDGARHGAEKLLAAAREQCRVLAAESTLVHQAHAEAASILAEARAASASVRAEIDAYVDTKLATFEALLSRTLTSVTRGRSRLVVPAADDPPADGADTPRSVRVLRWGSEPVRDASDAQDVSSVRIG